MSEVEVQSLDRNTVLGVRCSLLLAARRAAKAEVSKRGCPAARRVPQSILAVNIQIQRCSILSLSVLHQQGAQPHGQRTANDVRWHTGS
jgi:hypothetical protein